MNAEFVCTCPVPFRCELRCVDDSVDGSLSNSVLLLQQLDGLPQLIQLRVLTQGHTTRGSIHHIYWRDSECALWFN